ncbi:MAG: DnaA/Hda family protein [Simkaniaceae bacterium]
MKAWDDFIKRQEREIGLETTIKWLRPMKVVKSDAKGIVLEAKDAFQAHWFDEHMKTIAEKELKDSNGRNLRIKVQLSPSNIITQENDFTETKQKKEVQFAPDCLDPYALFDKFITVKESEISLRLLSELTGFDTKTGAFKSPNMDLGTFNPIYLHGAKGTGKSHLLMAAAKGLSRLGKHVFYVKAESFSEHVISAMRSSRMHPFRKTYRHIDVLIIDDVHLLARKKATQEELFHTFNALHTQSKQIIVSATCPPRLLQEIEERLVSRFEWGITLGLDRVGQAEVRQILQDRSELIRFPLKRDIQDYILDHFKSPGLALKALDCLVLRSHLSHKQRLSLTNARTFLADLIKSETKNGLNSSTILKTVAEVFGIKTEDILGKSQCREFVLPRQIAMYLCREKLKMPYTKIGSVFSRDHSTVMTSVKCIIKSLSNQDRDVTSSLTDIQRRVVNL